MMTNDCVYVSEQVVRKCNEGARTMERTEMMYTINSQLEFKIKVWQRLLLLVRFLHIFSYQVAKAQN